MSDTSEITSKRKATTPLVTYSKTAKRRATRPPPRASDGATHSDDDAPADEDEIIIPNGAANEDLADAQVGAQKVEDEQVEDESTRIDSPEPLKAAVDHASNEHNNEPNISESLQNNDVTVDQVSAEKEGHKGDNDELDKLESPKKDDVSAEQVSDEQEEVNVDEQEEVNVDEQEGVNGETVEGNNKKSTNKKRTKKKTTKWTTTKKSTGIWYGVEGILKERATEGKIEYLCDWEDVNGTSYEPTWEPADYVNDKAIAEWLTRKSS
jgi:hypothetical protein